MDKDTIKAALKEAVYQRRSTRAYTGEQVPEEVVEAILDAGRHAPSANNRQGTHFYVVLNEAKRAELTKVITGVFAGLEVKEGMTPPLVSSIERAKQGEVDPTYGAPVLIVTTNVKGNVNAAADCACAMENMMLTASAYGLGNCWVNQFFSFRDAPPVKEFFAGLGVTDEEEIYGSLAVGYTENLADTPHPRTGNPVTYIR